MHASKKPPEFTDKEKKILNLVQGDLPDTATPFADIAEMAGVSEQEVLDLLTGLKQDKVIRRFGATLRHQQAGYGHNAMVAWYVEDEQDVERIGEIMAARPEVSHCYQRKNCLDWPYNIYTMIHGRSPEDCEKVVKDLAEQTGVAQYDLLFSRRELKKTSMKYF